MRALPPALLLLAACSPAGVALLPGETAIPAGERLRPARTARAQTGAAAATLREGAIIAPAEGVLAANIPARASA